MSDGKKGRMTKIFGYVGFGIGMVCMFVFVPVSKSVGINALIGAVMGAVGGGVGALVGSLIDKQAGG